MHADIEIDSAVKTYRRDDGSVLTAVDRLSLSIPAGQVVGLLGPSGAGKTALLRMLACLEVPDSGRILLNGYDASRARASAADQVEALVDGAAGGDFETVFASERPILLVDEPASLRRGLLSRVREAHALGGARGAGRTVVVATSRADLARDLCDRAVVIGHGRLVTDVLLGGEASLSGTAFYEIKVKGRLESGRREFFEGLDIRTGEGITTITGPVADQAALHGLLLKVRDLGLPLLSVNRSAPDLDGLLARVAR